MDDDLGDLLGRSAPATKRRRGRPPNTRAQSTELLADDPDLRVTFLATIFQTA